MTGAVSEVAAAVGLRRSPPDGGPVPAPGPSRPPAPALPCRTPAGTCGACCRGPAVSPGDAARRMRRHAAWAQRLGTTRGGGLRLALHEVAVRRGRDLVLAPLLLVPGLGPALRRRIAARTVCAFLAFDDAAETRVGCLLHPSRRPGPDVRARAAYRLLRGLGCGDASWTCPAARAFAAAPPEVRRAAASAAPRPWSDYESATVRRFGGASGGPPCP